MVQNSSEHTKKFNTTYKILTSFIILILLLVSCINSNGTRIFTQLPTLYTTEATPTLTTTPTRNLPSQTSTSTSVVPTETPAATRDLGFFYNSLLLTQIPATITTHEPANNNYLYKYADVTFIIPFADESSIRLNLDNLDNNGEKNSDVLIHHSTGSGGTFIELYPINSATYYFSDLHSMSYDSCMEHFPFTNMDPDMYSDQSWMVAHQRDYCVLTDDGRLSIMRYVQDIFLPDDWYHVNLEIMVTTYNQIVPQALTPLATITPGPSPTPGRYTGMNLTQKQELGLDETAQAFLEAVTLYDIEKVADIIEYPLTVYYVGYDYPVSINTRAEFIAAYDGVFTQNFVEDLKNTSLEESMGIHKHNGISLLVKNGLIGFYPNGKIHLISNSSYWWKLENNNPS